MRAGESTLTLKVVAQPSSVVSRVGNASPALSRTQSNVCVVRLIASVNWLTEAKEVYSTGITSTIELSSDGTFAMISLFVASPLATVRVPRINLFGFSAAICKAAS